MKLFIFGGHEYQSQKGILWMQTHDDQLTSWWIRQCLPTCPHSNSSRNKLAQWQCRIVRESYQDDHLRRWLGCLCSLALLRSNVLRSLCYPFDEFKLAWQAKLGEVTIEGVNRVVMLALENLIPCDNLARLAVNDINFGDEAVYFLIFFNHI